MPKFVRDLALIFGTQVGQAAAAMVAGVLVSRLLGPAGNGTLSVLMALGTTAVLIATLGIHYSGIYFLGRFAAKRDAIISNNLAVGVLGGLATAAGLAVAVLLFRRQLLGAIPLRLFVLFLAFVPCNYFNQFARRLALGAGRVAMYNFPDLISGPGLLIGTAVGLFVIGRHLTPLVVLRVVIEAVTAAVMVSYVLRLLSGRVQPSLSLLREQARYGLRNYASSLLWLLLLQSDVVLCNYFLGRKPTGVYSVAVSLGLPVTLIASVLGALVFQRVSRDQDRANRIANTNRVLRLLAPLSALGGIALVVACKWLIPLIYGRRFAGAEAALALLMPGLVLLNLETILMSFFSGEGSPPIVYRAPVVGLLINFVANLFVIPRFGINGASTTSSIAYGVVFLLVLRQYRRATGSPLSEIFRLRAADVAAVRPRLPVVS